MAHHDSRMIVGLGSAQAAEWIEITWPSGNKERVEQVPAGSSLKITEKTGNEQNAVPHQYASFRLPDPLSAADSNWEMLKLAKGDKLPVIKVRKLNPDGTATPAELELDGAALVNFWATFCGPCRREMPELAKLHPELEEKRIQLIGLSLDTGPKGVLEFARKMGVKYPVYLVEKETLESIFGTASFPIPLSLYTDEKGKLTTVFTGWTPETEQGIEDILEGS